MALLSAQAGNIVKLLEQDQKRADRRGSGAPVQFAEPDSQAPADPVDLTDDKYVALPSESKDKEDEGYLRAPPCRRPHFS